MHISVRCFGPRSRPLGSVTPRYEPNRTHAKHFRRNDVVVDPVTDHDRLFRQHPQAFTRMQQQTRVGLIQARRVGNFPVFEIPENTDPFQLVESAGRLVGSEAQKQTLA